MAVLEVSINPGAVHVTDRLLEVSSGVEPIKTLIRNSRGEIRKKRAERTRSARTLT